MPKNYVIDAPTNTVRVLRLTLKQRLAILVFGSAKLDKIKLLPSWTNPMQFYVFKCKYHGLVASYPGSFDNILLCPMCLKSQKSEQEIQGKDSAHMFVRSALVSHFKNREFLHDLIA